MAWHLGIGRRAALWFGSSRVSTGTQKLSKLQLVDVAPWAGMAASQPANLGSWFVLCLQSCTSLPPVSASVAIRPSPFLRL